MVNQAILDQARIDEVSIRARSAALEAEHGSSHADTLKSYNELACVLSTLGKFDEAILIFRSVLERREATLGERHGDVFLTMRNLALTLEKTEKLGEAEALLMDCFSKQKRTLGETDRETLGTQRCLGMLLKKMRRPEEAERVLIKCLDLNESTYGMDHNTTTVVNDLAMVLRDQGKTDQAKALLEKCIRIKERSLGSSHPSTRSSVYNLIKVLQEIGDHREAIRYGSQLRLHLTNNVNNRTELIEVLKTMRKSLQLLGDSSEVRSHLHEVLFELLVLSRVLLGSDHPSTAILVRDVGLALKASGEVSRALPYYKEFYQMRKAKATPSDEDKKITLTALNNLATCYKALGRLEDAIPLFRQTLEGRKALSGPEDAEVGQSCNNLAMALYQLPSPAPLPSSSPLQQEQMQELPPWEEACELLVTAGSILHHTLGPESNDTRNCRGNLAIVRGRIAARIDSPQGLDRRMLLASREEIAEQQAFFTEKLGQSHAWTTKFTAELEFITSVINVLQNA